VTEYTLPVILLGAIIGSFLNVVIVRLPKKQSIVTKRSCCPSCKKNIKAYDLVPILSWILLKGRCRYCKKSISFNYPLVEFSTSILFLICFIPIYTNNKIDSIWLLIISGWVLVSYLISLTMIDINEMILPNTLTFSGSLIGLLVFAINDLSQKQSDNNYIIDHLFAFFTAALGFTLFNIIFRLIFNKTGLGGGDTKLFAMSGAWLGLTGLEVSITLSFIFSGIFSLIGLLFRKVERGSYIPFGPFICISILLVWIKTPQFWIEYLGNIFWWRHLY